MRRYFRIYKKLLGLNLQTLTAYKANFINSFLSTILWGSMTFISIFLLTSKISTVNGWTRNELILLTAVYNIVVGVFHMTFSRNFERFARLMHFAEFDALLIKPIDPQLSISFWLFNYTSIIRIIIGIIVAAAILNSEIFTKFYLLPAFIILSFMGTLLLYTVWFFISTLLVKFTNLSNLVDVLYQLNGLARYPLDVYSGLGVIGFSLVVPLTVIVTVPAKVLTLKLTEFDLFLFAAVTVLFVIASRLWWKFALRFYTSASG